MSDRMGDRVSNRRIAENYEDLIRQAVGLAATYSGAGWNANRLHDPGLTALQILTNALALDHESNASLLGSGSLFGQEEGTGKRWEEIPADPDSEQMAEGAKAVAGAAKTAAAGPDNAEQRLAFKPRLAAPSGADFLPMPVSRQDIRAAAESIPGLLKVWLVENAEFSGSASEPENLGGAAPAKELRRAEGQGETLIPGTPGVVQPELLLEFAPALSLRLRESLDTAERLRGAEPRLLRGHKRKLLREVTRLLQSIRSYCQPVLRCREARPAPLALELSLEGGALDEIGASGAMGGTGGLELYPPELQEALASIILALEKSMRRGETPPRCLNASDLLAAARADAKCASALAACKLKLTALRFGSCSQDGQIVEEGAETRCLPAGCDCFHVADWRISLTRGGRRDQISDECVRQAVFLAERYLLDELWRQRWRSDGVFARYSAHASGSAFGKKLAQTAGLASGQPGSLGNGLVSGFAGGRASFFGAENAVAGGVRPKNHAKEAGFLFDQFPELYGLQRLLVEGQSGVGGGTALGTAPDYDPAYALQLHGWLFLFERLLADARVPFADPDRFFNPAGLSFDSLPSTLPGALFADYGSGHPLCGKLLSGGNAGSQSALRRFYRERNRALLLHLAALQGENPWFSPDDLLYEGLQINGEAVQTPSLPELHEHYNRLLAVWLRALPRLNGRRLLRRWQDGGNFLESGGLSPLEERLSMLLLPYQAAHAAQMGAFAASGEQAAGGPEADAGYALEMRKSVNALTGLDEYRCYIYDGSGRLRIVCTLLSPTPEQAELVAASALRLAALAEHYHLEQGRIRIGWLAELHCPTGLDGEPGSGAGEHADKSPYERPSGKPVSSAAKAPEDPAQGGRPLRQAVKRNVEWSRSVLQPWVSVLDYSELGGGRPFELAVLVEAQLVPPGRRQALAERIRSHIPAHLLARVFFVSPEQRRLADALLHAPDSANYESLHTRHYGLLELLRDLEAEKAGDFRLARQN